MKSYNPLILLNRLAVAASVSAHENDAEKPGMIQLPPGPLLAPDGKANAIFRTGYRAE